MTTLIQDPMRTASEIAGEVEKYCRKHADEAIVTKYSRYFKEGYDAYGLAPGLLDAKRDEILKTEGITNQLIGEVCLLLVESPKYEMTSMALLLLKGSRKQWDSGTVVTLEQMFRHGIVNWAHTDWLCGELIPELMKKQLIFMDSLKPWRNAPNRFQRRAAVVGLIKPMKKSADIKPYLRFIEPMMKDGERVVHQGLGWFLREAWKLQPVPVEEFLLKWKNESARLIFQYATEKMDSASKARFRKEKQ